jgi:hypothetical protein
MERKRKKKNLAMEMFLKSLVKSFKAHIKNISFKKPTIALQM